MAQQIYVFAHPGEFVEDTCLNTWIEVLYV